MLNLINAYTWKDFTGNFNVETILSTASAILIVCVLVFIGKKLIKYFKR